MQTMWFRIHRGLCDHSLDLKGLTTLSRYIFQSYLARSSRMLPRQMSAHPLSPPPRRNHSEPN